MENHSLHEFILNHVKSDLIRLYNSEHSESALFAFLFSNYRRDYQGKHHGLRLSYVGDQLLCKYFSNYKMEHNLTHINHSIIIELDKKMLWPYYINATHITMYSDTDATWLALNGGTLKEYLEQI
jgi:hypothetical protein